MELYLRTKERDYIIPDVEEFEIRTRHGLELDSIPGEEGTQGFTCREITEEA